MVVCVAAAGMKDWVDGFIFVRSGDCCLGCRIGDGMLGECAQHCGVLKLLGFGS